MKPITSRIATGSLLPASPSRIWVRRCRSPEPRSRAKIAAASVEATIDPSSSPSSSESSKRSVAASPVMAAVSRVPSTAMLAATATTGRSFRTSVLRPPS